jgi:hypothetical protein
VVVVFPIVGMKETKVHMSKVIEDETNSKGKSYDFGLCSSIESSME